MSGFRIPGSLGIGIDLPIDSGTLSRSMSFIPGPTGIDDPLMQIARRAIRRGVHEGMNLAADVVIKAALRELRRLRGDVEAQLLLIAKLPEEVRKQVAYEVFAASFEHPLPKKFLRHYIWGDGTPLTLSEKEMIDCNPVIRLYKSPDFDALLTAARRQPDQPVSIDTKVPAGAMTNGTLGNFTVRVQGSLVALPNGGWSAKGTIEFYDLWNFDPKWFAKGSNRSLQGELKTITGHMLLPGRGFEIHSASVPFSQTDNDPTVVWAGGTPQGVPDRVSQVESGG